MLIQLWEKTPPKWQVITFGILAIIIGAVIGIGIGITPSIIYPIAAVLGIVVVILTITNLEFGLLVFIVITYLRVSDIAVHNYDAPSIARPYFILLVIAVVLRWAITRNLPRGWTKPALLILAYGMVIFGSIVYAADFASAQAAASDYFKDGLIAVLIAALIQTKITFRHVIWALLFSGIFLGALSVFQYVTGTYDYNYLGFAQAPLLQIVGDTEGNRVAGPIGDPNSYAQIMVVLLPLAINRMTYEKKPVLKWLAAFGVIVITLTVIFTFSRGGFLALIFVLIVLTIYRPPNLALLLVLIAAAWFIVIMLPNNFLDRMSTITGVLSGEQDVRNEGSLSGRASVMITAYEMLLDHPILGVGAHNFPVYYLQYARKLGIDSSNATLGAHSLYLQVAAETGLMGIMIFGTIIFYVFKCIHFARKKLKLIGDNDTRDLIGAFSTGFLGYLMAALFIHGAYPRYLWLLVGIAFALPNIVRKEIKKQSFEQ